MNLRVAIIALFSVVAINANAQEPSAPETPMRPPVAPGTDITEAPPILDFIQRSNSILAKIRDNDREIDPFGLPMDPTNAVNTLAMSDEFEDVQESTVLNASAFKTALQGLPISGIYPKGQTVVIGARSFDRGDQFGMKLEELTIRLRVEGIKGTSIFFKDMDTQEVASVEFNPRPAEFEPIVKGSKNPTAKGIIPMNELFIVN